jgi:hypothetical protein
MDRWICDVRVSLSDGERQFLARSLALDLGGLIHDSISKSV